MKKRRWPYVVGILVVIIVGLGIYLFTGAKNPNTTANIEKGEAGTKSIVVYFSRDNALEGKPDAVTSATPSSNGGNTSDTEAAARMVQKETGADLYAMRVAHYYRTPFMSTVATSWVEGTLNTRPKLTALPESLDDYDTIYIGYPIWWYTFPMIIYTLFDEYDFSGKTVIPFNTHMGSRDGGTYKTIKKLATGATVLEGMPIDMNEAERGNPAKIEKWLKKIGM